MATYEGIELPLNLGTTGLNESLSNMDAVLEILRQINKTVGEISGKMGGVGDNMSAEMGKAEKGADRLIDKLGKIGLAIQGIKGIAQSVMGSLQPIFEEGLSRDVSKAALSKLLKNTDVETYAKNLRESLGAKLYGSGAMSNAARTMMSFGIDENKTMRMLDAISNIAGGNRQSFESLVLSFSQATSLGKLQGQDKLQMIGAGFNPLVQLAEDLKKPVSEIDAMMSKGLITADMLEQAFTNATTGAGKFAGAAEAQMQGLNGQIKAFQAQMSNLFAALYEALLPVSTSVMPVLTNLVTEAISLVPQLSTVFEALAVVTGSLSTAYAIYWAWQNKVLIWTKMQTVATQILGAVQKVTFGGWIAIFTALMAIIASFANHWDYLKKAFTDGGILHGIMAIGKVLLDSVLAPIQYLLDLLSNVPGLGKLAGKGSGYIKDLRARLFGDTSGGVTPGESGNAGMGGATDNTGAVTPGAMAAGASAVATGGTRNTSITITMGSLVHQINYQGGIEKNSRETTQDLQEALLRVLNAAANTAE